MGGRGWAVAKVGGEGGCGLVGREVCTSSRGSGSWMVFNSALEEHPARSADLLRSREVEGVRVVPPTAGKPPSEAEASPAKSVSGVAEYGVGGVGGIAPVPKPPSEASEASPAKSFSVPRVPEYGVGVPPALGGDSTVPLSCASWPPRPKAALMHPSSSLPLPPPPRSVGGVTGVTQPPQQLVEGVRGVAAVHRGRSPTCHPLSASAVIPPQPQRPPPKLSSLFDMLRDFPPPKPPPVTRKAPPPEFERQQEQLPRKPPPPGFERDVLLWKPLLQTGKHGCTVPASATAAAAATTAAAAASMPAEPAPAAASNTAAEALRAAQRHEQWLKEREQRQQEEQAQRLAAQQLDQQRQLQDCQAARHQEWMRNFKDPQDVEEIASAIERVNSMEVWQMTPQDVQVWGLQFSQAPPQPSDAALNVEPASSVGGVGGVSVVHSQPRCLGSPQESEESEVVANIIRELPAYAILEHFSASRMPVLRTFRIETYYRNIFMGQRFVGSPRGTTVNVGNLTSGAFFRSTLRIVSLAPSGLRALHGGS
jgi:hypothetical protein